MHNSIAPLDKYTEVDAEYRVVQRQYRVAGFLMLFVITCGAIFYRIVEQFRWLDAVYFCTITLTTIGYGDLTPRTDAGKLFTIVYVLVCSGILVFFANLLVRHAVLRREVRRSKDSLSKETR